MKPFTLAKQLLIRLLRALYRQAKATGMQIAKPLLFQLRTARWRRNIKRYRPQQQRAITIRSLDPPDPTQLAAIDVSETIHYQYHVTNSQLQRSAVAWRRAPWDAAKWQQSLTRWNETLKPDLFLGAYDGDQLIGMASVRYHLTPTTAQLTSLFVSRPYRQHGVGAQLLQTVSALAKDKGAHELYVSSVSTLPTVHFYLRQGFRLTPEPHPILFALDPADIHMSRPLSGEQQIQQQIHW